MDSETRASEARRFFLQQFVGFSQMPEGPVQEIYAKALLICATGDGVLHPDERAWVRGYFSSTGAPDSVLALIEDYDGSDDLVGLLQMDERTARMAARSLVFDALRVCAADGELAPAEIDKVYEIGRKMGLNDRQIKQVENAYRVWQSAVDNRMSVVYPEEAPYQD